MRVLVLSDEPGVRQRATTNLRMRPDVEIVEVDSALEAHGAVETGQFDVLVFDGDLEPEGGYSVLYEIRQAGLLDGQPTPPALVLAGREQDRWLAAWAGANQVIVKPADPFEVARAVTELVGEPPAESAAGDESASEVEAALGAEDPMPG